MFKNDKLINGDRIYHLNQDVLLHNQGNIAQLLDFNQGEFYALDSMATMMVSSVLDQGVEATVDDLSQIYDTTQEEIRSDLSELLKTLVNKRLLISRKINIQKRKKLSDYIKQIFLHIFKIIIRLLYPIINPQSYPNLLTIHSLLILSWLSFRFLGWSNTIYLWQKWHQNTLSHTVDLKNIKNLDNKLQEAAASNPFLPIVCKERALVGYHLLHTFYQLPATLIIGISNDPFEVHAWVEWESMIFTDDPAHCQQFTPVISYQ